MIEGEWHQPDAPTARWKRLRAGRARVVAPVVAAACIFGGVTSALAQSGEDTESIQLSGADACPGPGLDALLYCFASEDQPGDCKLFDTDSPYSLVGTLLCPTRGVLETPELQPLDEPLHDVPIQAMSDGWLRALLVEGASEPTYTVTQFLGPNADTVVVAPPELIPENTPTCTDPQPQIGADSAAFCSALEDALPEQQEGGGEIVLAIGYEWNNLPFDPGQFMTVWACGGRQAKCIKGSPASLGAQGATVLNQQYLLVVNDGHSHLTAWR